MKKTLLLVGLLFVVELLAPGCAPAVTVTTSSPMPEKARLTGLKWSPTMIQSDLDLEPLTIYGSITVTLSLVDDVRENPHVIGKTFEDMKVRNTYLPVATKVNVAKWCKKALLETFKILNMATDAKHGNLHLEIEIAGLSINDDITQTGDAVFRISAMNAEKMLIWEGQISGTSDLYVRPKDSNGVSECLSNTIMVTLNNALVEKSFRDAVIKAYDL